LRVDLLCRIDDDDGAGIESLIKSPNTLPPYSSWHEKLKAKIQMWVKRYVDNEWYLFANEVKLASMRRATQHIVIICTAPSTKQLPP